MATTTNPAPTSTTTTTPVERKPKRQPFTAGVGRRTVGQLITMTIAFAVLSFIMFDPTFVRVLIKLGGAFALPAIILLTTGVAVIVLNLVQPESFSRRTRTVIAIFASIAIIIGMLWAGLAIGSGVNPWMILAVAGIVLGIQIIIWFAVAFDFSGYLGRKTDR